MSIPNMRKNPYLMRIRFSLKYKSRRYRVAITAYSVEEKRIYGIIATFNSTVLNEQN